MGGATVTLLKVTHTHTHSHTREPTHSSSLSSAAVLHARAAILTWSAPARVCVCVYARVSVCVCAHVCAHVCVCVCVHPYRPLTWTSVSSSSREWTCWLCLSSRTHSSSVFRYVHGDTHTHTHSRNSVASHGAYAVHLLSRDAARIQRVVSDLALLHAWCLWHMRVALRPCKHVLNDMLLYPNNMSCVPASHIVSCQRHTYTHTHRRTHTRTWMHSRDMVHMQRISC